MALGFPLLFVISLAAGFIRTGFSIGSFLTHGVLVATIIPAAPAMVYWCKRYTGPALQALRQREAISIEDGRLVVYDDQYPITADASLEHDQSRIKLIERGAIIATVPGFFIRIIA